MASIWGVRKEADKCVQRLLRGGAHQTTSVFGIGDVRSGRALSPDSQPEGSKSVNTDKENTWFGSGVRVRLV